MTVRCRLLEVEYGEGVRAHGAKEGFEEREDGGRQGRNVKTRTLQESKDCNTRKFKGWPTRRRARAKRQKSFTEGL